MVTFDFSGTTITGIAIPPQKLAANLVSKKQVSPLQNIPTASCRGASSSKYLSLMQPLIIFLSHC